MPSIKPVSDLCNYTEVLRECRDGEPVFFTKNGIGKYVLIDMHEYERQLSIIELFYKLSEANALVKIDEKWQSIYELQCQLGI